MPSSWCQRPGQPRASKAACPCAILEGFRSSGIGSANSEALTAKKLFTAENAETARKLQFCVLCDLSGERLLAVRAIEGWLFRRSRQWTDDCTPRS